MADSEEHDNPLEDLYVDSQEIDRERIRDDLEVLSGGKFFLDRRFLLYNWEGNLSFPIYELYSPPEKILWQADRERIRFEFYRTARS
jgi:hypothetical protein